MYSNILVPVVFDHGERGMSSLKIAQNLLSENGKVTLMHVIEEIPSYASSFLPAELAQQHHDEAMRGLQELANTNGVDCDVVVVHGHPYSSILEFGKTRGIDCIVIASHKPGFEDYFLGSTAARVVRHAKCGVHILR